MKIFFESESDKKTFEKWLLHVQDLATNIQVTLEDPSLIENPDNFVKYNAVSLWYRVYEFDPVHLHLISKPNE
jgi:hypothetical protein